VPRPYPYAMTLNSALRRLRRIDIKQVNLTRHDIERCFGVKKTAAQLIMKVSGPIRVEYRSEDKLGPSVPVVSRADVETFLLEAIKAVKTEEAYSNPAEEVSAVNAAFAKYMEERVKTAGKRRAPRPIKLFTSLPSIPVMLEELPPSIQISQGRRDESGRDECRIKYRDFQDLVQLVQSLVFAMSHDLATFQQVADPKPEPIPLRRMNPEFARMMAELEQMERNKSRGNASQNIES
jgi:hypothetical protein